MHPNYDDMPDEQLGCEAVRLVMYEGLLKSFDRLTAIRETLLRRREREMIVKAVTAGMKQAVAISAQNINTRLRDTGRGQL